jgi:hypothetical protein
MTTEKRKIKAKDVVADMRSGNSNADLMARYQLEPERLEEIFRRLLDAGLILDIELVGRVPVVSRVEAPSGPTPKRAPRSYLMVPLPVYDLDDMTLEGRVHDISRTGLQVSGIKTQAGDKKSLLIQADEFADVYPFALDAVCKWATQDSPDEECTAGFEITTISGVGAGELEKLCQLLAISE